MRAHARDHKLPQSNEGINDGADGDEDERLLRHSLGRFAEDVGKMAFRIEVEESDHPVDDVVYVAMTVVPDADSDGEHQDDLDSFEHGNAAQRVDIPMLLVRQVDVFGNVQSGVHGAEG